jgi:aminoglycoside phosphotransferase family enzyme/predicted kinase
MHRQADIFQAMAKPQFYPHPVISVQQRETHISKVFLTGDYVYKVKKSVNLDFLDFTTLSKRCHYCQRELVLNKRLSRNIYLDVLPITCEGSKYSLNGPGRPVEYTLKMRQLPANTSMLNLLQRGKIADEALKMLAGVLGEFYVQADRGSDIDMFGDWESIRANCEENFKQTQGFLGQILSERMYDIVRAATQSFLRRQRDLFQHRIDRESICDCHGDLRTGHIYFIDGVQIIDCIEFNDRFRYGDIASDLAFLAMDLDYEGYPEISQFLIKAYVQNTGDQNVFVLLDFYKCYRAFVRAKVNCLRLNAPGSLSEPQREALLKQTQRYMDLAYRYAIQFTRPTLWVICGLPASGKSTIARELSASLGVKVLQSDVIRKELFDLAPSEQLIVPFEQGVYSKGATALTYGRLLLLAQDEIKTGSSVIIDATYGRRHHRDEVFRLARDMDVNLIFVECICPETLIKNRLKGRELISTTSDARLRHLEQIAALFDPIEEVPPEMHIRVNTEGPLGKSMDDILAQDYVLECVQTEKLLHKELQT